jgi:endonuclease YncB( thermonuclease family)
MSVYGPFKAVITKPPHDGDTVYMNIDVAFAHFVMSHDFDGKPLMSCRVFGINSPELGTIEGNTARDFIQMLLKPGDRIMVTSVSWDKYGGRFDGSITLPDGRDLAHVMVESGHAVFKDFS